MADIGGANYHIFWMTCWVSVKFSGKHLGFTLSLENSILKKTQGGG